MALTDRAQIRYESGQNSQDFEAMSDSGDRMTFSSSFSPWSKKSGAEATVRPYGLATGGAIIPAISGSNNVVDTAALTAYMAGNAGADAEGLVSVSAGTDVTCARPTVDTHLVHSITVNSSGAIAVVSGAEGTSFSETRAANGGPPLIPTTSIEIGQVRLSSQTAAPVLASEIKQVVGTHQERWDFPGWTENARTGEVTFFQALPASHTGPVAKSVYVKGNVPVFAQLERAFDYVPADTSYSSNSQDTYDGAVGGQSSSLNAATFSAILKDGITDNILAQKGQVIWIEFKQDRNKAPRQLTVGTLGLSREFTKGSNPQCDFTLTPETESADLAS